MEVDGHALVRGWSTVVGDAGVGKSRLIREFADGRGATSAQVLRGRCLPYGEGITFWPIAEIVRAAAGIADEDPPDDGARQDRRAGSASDGSSDRARSCERVAARSGCRRRRSRSPSSSGASAGCSRRSRAGGRWSLIVDDIHWRGADVPRAPRPPARRGPRRADPRCSSTARHELLETRGRMGATAHDATRIVLEPLSTRRRRGDRRPAARRPGSTPASATGSSRRRGQPALRRADHCRCSIETGAIRREGDGGSRTRSSRRDRHPADDRGARRGPARRLAAEERAVIEPASVIGLRVRRRRGRAAGADRAAPGDVARRISRRWTASSSSAPTRRRRGRLPLRAPADPGRGLRSLLKRTRADLHERFVDWAEPINRERGREIEFEEILGYHLEQAYRYRASSARSTTRAGRIGQRAADEARRSRQTGVRSWGRARGREPAPAGRGASCPGITLPTSSCRRTWPTRSWRRRIRCRNDGARRGRRSSHGDRMTATCGARPRRPPHRATWPARSGNVPSTAAAP